MNKQDWAANALRSLHWLKRSIDINGGNGSSAYFARWRQPLNGWAPAYPETTGYLIETLLDYHAIFPGEGLESYALKCADWLCEVQHPGGAFPALYATSKQPSVFNTGMVLFGLARAYSQTEEQRYLRALDRAVTWMTEGDWREKWAKYNFVSNYFPAYFTRVLWAILVANELLERKGLQTRVQKMLREMHSRILENGAVKDWGFLPGVKAYTHTIAYTFRGFYETSKRLQEEAILDQLPQMLEPLLSDLSEKGKLAGRYDQQWRGDYRFRCMPGEAQLSILFRKLGYDIAADQLLEQVVSAQRKSGAIPGSQPLWGRYMRGKYPNWGVKFFLDALKSRVE